MSDAQKYTVTAVTGSRPWTPKGETEVKRVYYDVQVEGIDGKVELGLLPTDPKPEVRKEIFAVLKPGEGDKAPTLVPVGQKAKGGGGFRGKSPEELAHDKANSALIRSKEFYELIGEKPSLREYLETAGKIHTASTRLASGQVALEA